MTPTKLYMLHSTIYTSITKVKKSNCPSNYPYHPFYKGNLQMSLSKAGLKGKRWMAKASRDLAKPLGSIPVLPSPSAPSPSRLYPSLFRQFNAHTHPTHTYIPPNRPSDKSRHFHSLAGGRSYLVSYTVTSTTSSCIRDPPHRLTATPSTAGEFLPSPLLG